MLKLLLKHELITKIFYTTSSRALSACLGMLLSVFIARNLSLSGQGEYAVFISTVLIVSQVMSLGINSANTFYVAKSQELKHSLASNSFLFTLFSTFLWIVFIFFYRYVTHDNVFATEFLLSCSFLLIPVEFLFSQLQSLSLGLINLRLFNSIDLIRKSTTIIFLLILFFLKDFTLQNVVAVNIIAGFLSVLILSYFLLESIKIKPSLIIFKQSLKYGIWIYIGTVFAFLTLRFDLLMINHFMGTNGSGSYSIAVALADAIYLIPTTIGMVLFSAYVKEENILKKWELVKKLSQKLFLFLILPMLVLFILSDFLIIFIYGEKFRDSIICFKVLLPGILFLSLTTQMQNFLSSLERPAMVCIGPGIALIINIALNYLFIPKYGVVGASLASTIAYTVWFFVALILCKKRVSYELNGKLIL